MIAAFHFLTALSGVLFKADQVYEDRAYPSLVGLCPGGEVYFTDDVLTVLAEGRATTIRVPYPRPLWSALGTWGQHDAAISVRGPSGVYDVFRVSRRGMARVVLGLTDVQPSGASGAFVCGTKYASGREPSAYRWSGRWTRLTDAGEVAVANRVEADGTVLGSFRKNRRSLPCLWDVKGKRIALPLPAQFGSGASFLKSSQWVCGVAERKESLSPGAPAYDAWLAWRDGRVSSLWPERLLLANTRQLGPHYAQGDDLFGNVLNAPAAVLVRQGRIYPVRVKARGRTYVVETVVAGDGRRIFGTGHREGTPSPQPGTTVIVFTVGP